MQASVFSKSLLALASLVVGSGVLWTLWMKSADGVAVGQIYSGEIAPEVENVSHAWQPLVSTFLLRDAVAKTSADTLLPLSNNEYQRWVDFSNETLRYRPFAYGVRVFRANLEMARNNTDAAREQLELSKMTAPRVYWNWGPIGDAYLQLGDVDQALDAYSNQLRYGPHSHSYVDQVAEKILPLAPDRNKAVSYLLPDLPPVRDVNGSLEAVVFRNARVGEDVPLMMEVWRKAGDVLSNQKINFPRRFMFAILKSGSLSDVTDAWQLLERSERTTDEIFNGGFESQIRNYPLGWIAGTQPGYQVAADDQVRKSGKRSMRVRFDGKEKINGVLLRQRFPISGPGEYEITAHWRGEEITTRKGVALEAISTGGEKRERISTEERYGSWDWEPITLKLQVVEAAPYISVWLRRWENKDLDNKIKGRVWLDDVVVRRIR